MEHLFLTVVLLRRVLDWDAPLDKTKAPTMRDMRRFALISALMIALTALPGMAQEWVAMSGAQIRDALTGRVLAYPDTTQDFLASGRTLYIHKGRESWGYWRVQGDQYCSQWPPNDLWACYDMERRGAVLRFVGAGADITEARYAE